MKYAEFIQGGLSRGALGLVLLLGISVEPGRYMMPTNAGPPAWAAVDQAEVGVTFGRLPLAFEANRGQIDARVDFVARAPGYTLLLTRGEAVVALRQHAARAADAAGGGATPKDPAPLWSKSAHSVGEGGEAAPVTTVMRMRLVGARNDPAGIGLAELPGKVNHFVGNDPAGWRTDVPTYGKVRYSDVYPGVDLIYYGNQRQLEYDFVVGPGADPGAILLRFEGADTVEVDSQGELVLRVGGAEIRQRPPIVYQEIDGSRRTVAGGYVLRGERQVGFEVAKYDPTRVLVIDPVLLYSTYLSGNGADNATSIALDKNGNAYITGHTGSTNFSTTLGAFDITYAPPQDAFVTKLNATGSTVLYSTYLGGDGGDAGFGIAVDDVGSAYIAGWTTSANFPTTLGAFDRTLNGFADAFVTKLNPTGSALVYSTYLGGTHMSEGHSIAIDSDLNAYVTGFNDSTDFPTTPGAVNVGGGGFVTKLNAAGSNLVYSGTIGGTGNGIALDQGRNAYVTGSTTWAGFPTTAGAWDTTFNGFSDAFVLKLNDTGSALLYSTFLGGSVTAEGASIATDFGAGIAIDMVGNAYVAGGTTSVDFPTTVGAFQPSLRGIQDAFVTKLNPAGSALVYSTYLGGTNGTDVARGIAVDASGNAYVTGQTSANDFPLLNPVQSQTGAAADAFVTKLNPAGTAPVYSTYLGGFGDDIGRAIAVDNAGIAYLVGQTSAGNFPTVNSLPAPNNAHQLAPDAFVARIGEPCTPRPNVTVATEPANPGSLQVTITANRNASTPNNLLRTLRFGEPRASENALVVFQGQPLTEPFPPVQVTPPQQQVAFQIRQQTPGVPATVHFVVVDDCGDWPTFAGGGAAALGNATSGALGAPSPTATVAIAATPTRPPGGTAASPTPVVVCQPRPAVAVTSRPDGPGRLQVTASASGAGNTLRGLRFGSASNALIDVGDQVGRTGGFEVSLPAGRQQISLAVRAATAGQGVMVPLTVLDACGEWPTFVGSGPSVSGGFAPASGAE